MPCLRLAWTLSFAPSLRGTGLKSTSTVVQALCSSNGFEADQLRTEAGNALEHAGSQSVGGFDDWIKQLRLPEDTHYSRLMAIGLFSLLEASKGMADKATDVEHVKSKASELSESLNLVPRVDKDINLFLTSRERMARR